MVSSHFRCFASPPAATSPNRLSLTGPIPQNPRMLRSRLLSECAPKYQRYINAGIPMVTTIRPVLPLSNFFPIGDAPFGSAKPGRNTCSKNALSSAGIAPSQSG
jgi:hypothetical protein